MPNTRYRGSKKRIDQGFLAIILSLHIIKAWHNSPHMLPVSMAFTSTATALSSRRCYYRYSYSGISIANYFMFLVGINMSLIV